MKYNISKEFGIFRSLKPPFNALAVRAGQPIMALMPNGMKSCGILEITSEKVPVAGGKSIKIYIIRPRRAEGKTPVIMHFHGGAFAFKGAPFHYKVAKSYADKAGMTVVFVDYRMAFSTPFNTPLDDCERAYSYVAECADGLCIDLSRVIFSGDSAGGYLAVALAKRCTANGLPPPAGALLVYPEVDPEGKSESMKKFTDTPVWNAKLNKKMWKMYSKGNRAYNPLADRLSFMPKTYIETAEFDCLHDEGVELFHALADLNIECTLNETRETMHGYEICLTALTVQKAMKRRIEFLKTFTD